MGDTPRSAPRLRSALAFAMGVAVASVGAQRADDIEVVQVTSDVYMLAGAGGNVTVQVGSQGVFVVDTGSEAMSAKTVAAIRKISDRPIRYIVNTSADPDHTGGNAAVDKLGAFIPTRELIEEVA
jgi:glyoxylase-like metal-dependent hydrolase (beta-lactamase superfamily II)